MIIEIRYVTTADAKNLPEGVAPFKVHYFRGNVTGTPVAGEVCLSGRVADKLAAFVTGDQDNPSPAFEAGVMPVVELHETHYRMADVPKTFEVDGELHTSVLSTDTGTPIHKIYPIVGADETKVGWSLLKSVPRRAAPVKAPELADTELAALLAG